MFFTIAQNPDCQFFFMTFNIYDVIADVCFRLDYLLQNKRCITDIVTT